MDLVAVESVRVARTRDDLALAPGETVIGGGTWLYSEPQPGVRGVVDLTGLGWTPLEALPGGTRIAATCTLAELRTGAPALGSAAGVAVESVEALLGSWKIHRIATVGGNVCLALPAGPMTSLTAALDGTAVVWTADGGERRIPVAEFVTDVRTTALAPGDVLRAIDLPEPPAAVALRRASLAPLGRSAALVIGRLDADGTVVLTVTAATRHPVQLRFGGLPAADELVAAVDAVPEWHDDAHGAPDWRYAMVRRFALELRDELAEAA